jgi:hypothetical protein
MSLQDEDIQCPICLNNIENIYITKCNHKFCTNCINLWKEFGNQNCPCCRKINYYNHIINNNIVNINSFVKINTFNTKDILLFTSFHLFSLYYLIKIFN